jgi:hypothetical protein
MPTRKKQLVSEVCRALIEYGYIVYISGSGEHGFYTDGKKVVSFEGAWGTSINYTGNYISKRCGTGWQISADGGIPSRDIAAAFIAESAPRWATEGEAVKATTPGQQLKIYGASSGYSLFSETGDTI